MHAGRYRLSFQTVNQLSAILTLGRSALGRIFRQKLSPLAGLLEHMDFLLGHIHRMWNVLQGGEPGKEDIKKDPFTQPLD